MGREGGAAVQVRVAPAAVERVVTAEETAACREGTEAAATGLEATVATAAAAVAAAAVGAWAAVEGTMEGEAEATVAPGETAELGGAEVAPAAMVAAGDRAVEVREEEAMEAQAVHSGAGVAKGVGEVSVVHSAAWLAEVQAADEGRAEAEDSQVAPGGLAAWEVSAAGREVAVPRVAP